MSIRPFQGIYPAFGAQSFIDPSAVLIGQVTLGTDCSVWPLAVLRGDVHSIVVGDRTNIQDGSIFHGTHPSAHTNPQGYGLVLGNDITVGHRVTLHGCHIADRCLIGMDSTIMDGAYIPSDVIIGAKSLVSPGKALESGYLYVGSPVVQKRALTPEEIAFILYSAQHYVRLKDKYLSEPIPVA